MHEWQVVFKDLEFKTYKLEVYANNRLLDNQETITIQTRGITINDDI